MPHDAAGQPLKVGDYILVPYQIEQIHTGEDYCNLTARSIMGRKPDGYKELYQGNAAVAVRYNPEDTLVRVSISYIQLLDAFAAHITGAQQPRAILEADVGAAPLPPPPTTETIS